MTGLVGDVGGTNARFALVGEDGAPRYIATLACAAYPSLEAVVGAYLAGTTARVASAVIAIAGPIVDGGVHVTNLGWSTSERAMSHALGVERVRFCNDYAALAHAAPRMSADDLHPLGASASGVRGSIVVLGPGTGFGASALVREEGAEAVAVGEGGHIAFAPVDEEDREILRRLAHRHGRVSIERILSGPGLEALHDVLGDIDGRTRSPATAAEITRDAHAGEVGAGRTVRRFCAILGSTAGDMALAFGARGGVQIAGGIAPRILRFLEETEFRRRFESKGRFEGYMTGIATHVIVHEHPALVGAAAMLEGLRRG